MPKRKQESQKRSKQQKPPPNSPPPSPEKAWHEGPWSVPPGMALALGSNRPELVKLAIGDAERGATEVSRELVIELMRLVADLMGVINVQTDTIDRQDAQLENWRAFHLYVQAGPRKLDTD